MTPPPPIMTPPPPIMTPPPPYSLTTHYHLLFFQIPHLVWCVVATAMCSASCLYCLADHILTSEGRMASRPCTGLPLEAMPRQLRYSVQYSQGTPPPFESLCKLSHSVVKFQPFGDVYQTLFPAKRLKVTTTSLIGPAQIMIFIGHMCTL